MTCRIPALPVLPALLLATPLAAQVALPPGEAAQAAEAASPTPTPTPAPTPAPTVAVPPPVLLTLPVATPAPEPRATPARRATPVPRSTPTETPAPTSTPTGAVTPAPAGPPDAAAVAPPVAVVAGRPASALPRTGEPEPLWALPVSGGLVAGLVLIAFVIRRRRRRALAGEGEDLPAGEPIAPDMPVAVDAPLPPVPAGKRADVSFVLRPRRAGVNLLTATLDAEIVVRNDGDAPAERVRVDLRLLSARGQQEDELTAVFADDGARPAAPLFTLASGEERAVSTLATLARQDINVVTAGERPMFVPVAAVSIRYRDGDRAAQVAQAFALGVERNGAEKLAPFWLDAPSRMHDAIGLRPYAPEVRR